EHLGAYGIDADVLSHRAISKGAPGYDQVVDMFGRWILNNDGEIDRAKLAQLVFSNPDALIILETIVHPLVNQALDMLVKRSTQNVIVIEAIKLIETPINEWCDNIWVTYLPEETQVSRLMKKRGMSLDEIQRRLEAQSAHEEKSKDADVVIYNDGEYEETWKQVVTAWNAMFPSAEPEQMESTITGFSDSVDELKTARGKPSNAQEIAELINVIHAEGEEDVNKADVLEAFGEKAFILLKKGKKPVGLIGWQIENLVARTTDILIDNSVYVDEALPKLVSEMEKSSIDLQCEASLVFVSDEIASYASLWDLMGYKQKTPKQLGVTAWQEAAQEHMDSGCILYFKQLRQDRVLRPI
ncbi:MAG: dephospho-CoA kinase, partial [Anaerolineaceae bacterium]|nr:dephospho-CoA kinase [Anaerolineaceae bacterium]